MRFNDSFEFPKETKQDEISASEALALLYLLVESSSESERMALFLSSCRNPFLTANSIFYDLRLAIGGADYDSSLEHAIAEVSKGRFFDAQKRVKENVSAPVSEAIEKFDVWENRKNYLDYISNYLDSRSVSHRQRSILNDVLFAPKQRSTFFERHEYQALFEIKAEGHEAVLNMLSEFKKFLEPLELITEVFWDYFNYKRDQSELTRGDFLPFSEGISGLGIRPARGIEEIRKAISEIGRLIPNLDLHDSGESLVLKENSSANCDGNAARVEISFNVSSQKVFWGEIKRLLGFAVVALQNRLVKLVDIGPRDTLLPDPYLIDFISYPIREEVKRFEINRLPLHVSQHLDVAKIGVVSAGFLKDKVIRSSTPEYRSKKVRLFIEESIRLIVEAAKNVNCHFLLFPECFVPDTFLDEVEAMSQDSDLTILGGIETRVDDVTREYDNRGFLVSDHSYGVKMFDKITESVGEPKLVDRVREAGFFYQSGAGKIAVIICSDLLDGELISAVHSRKLDVCFLPTFNPHPNLFLGIAYSDAHRYWCNVAISNVVIAHDWKQLSEMRDGSGSKESFSGSGCLSPQRDFSESLLDWKDRILVAEDSKMAAVELQTHDFDLEVFRKEKSRLHDKRFMSPHSSIRH